MDHVIKHAKSEKSVKEEHILEAKNFIDQHNHYAKVITKNKPILTVKQNLFNMIMRVDELKGIMLPEASKEVQIKKGMLKKNFSVQLSSTTQLSESLLKTMKSSTINNNLFTGQLLNNPNNSNTNKETAISHQEEVKPKIRTLNNRILIH